MAFIDPIKTFWFGWHQVTQRFSIVGTWWHLRCDTLVPFGIWWHLMCHTMNDLIFVDVVNLFAE
jgi:hypothetical protein